MEKLSIEKQLKENAYPGRGIIIGKSADGTCAVTAYFIMGRSENSRNRVFVEDGDGIRTEAFDASKLVDPSLIIYAPVRVLGNKTIVTNGDQTDTVYDLMDKQQTFEQSLRTREFEPDGPNFTPRISGIIHQDKGSFNYALSILKSNNRRAAIAIHLPTIIHLTGRAILSIHIWATAIRCQVLRANRNGWILKAISIPLQIKSGTA